MKSKSSALIQFYFPFFTTRNYHRLFPSSPLKTISLNPRFYSTAAALCNETYDDRIVAAGIEDKPVDTADVLRNWGCTENEVAKVFWRQPSMRKMDAKNLESKLKMLSDLGIASSDLVKMVHCRPRFINSRINHCLDERIEYLESLFESREVLLKAIVRNPSLLTYDLQKIKPVISMYESVGVSRKDLVPMLISRPTMIPRCNLDDKRLEYIQRTGVSKDSRMYKYVVTIISISRIETIQQKVANFEKFGLSEDEVFHLFGRSPLVLTLSTDKVQRNMTFLIGKMKLSARSAVAYPCLLYFNLERVIKPRYFLAEKIEDMGLVPEIKGPNMMRALRMKEKRFIKVFINCHPEDIAKQLMDFYTNAKCIKRLAESSKKILHIGFPF
ncbi:hypothetical protein M9H77_01867 [Catharanthus roseus]|uniref:Uncharacterized protein n=1 Tax=Catharanthus roseus TaxID=4058 RepID=A0ACC0C6W7_CATRO|nr:hypothetical protein M9H77_01867 [Catharanthus roseus]